MYTVSGTILSNVLSGQLRGRISDSLIGQLISSAFALKDLPLTGEERDMITRAYMTGLRAVFVSFAALAAVYFCSCVCIRDYGLKQGKARRQQEHVGEERVQSSREEQQSDT